MYIVQQGISILFLPPHQTIEIKNINEISNTGHHFLENIENLIWTEPLLRGHLSYKATLSLS